MDPTQFPWDALEAIVGGDSAIDVPRLRVHSAEAAEEFLRCYGLDPRSPADSAELAGLLAEAWELIEQELLVGLAHLVPPPEVRQETDVRLLLVQASAADDRPEQRWACAVLRVAHVLAHAGSPIKERFAPEIVRQIAGRFEPHLFDGQEGRTLGQGPDGVPVLEFQLRTAKSRRSIALKLLVKAESAAADVFDRIGLRFVTRDRLDALRVVHYLHKHRVIMFANIKPSRSRNSLVDLDALRERMAGVPLAADMPGWRSAAQQVGPPSAPGGEGNPHTAVDYRAIQFTCRQLIHVQDMRFFFPFEVQILDVDGFEESRSGRGSHADYKARQRQSVRRRVLGPLLLGPGG